MKKIPQCVFPHHLRKNKHIRIENGREHKWQKL